jgi:hypothetical protein
MSRKKRTSRALTQLSVQGEAEVGLPFEPGSKGREVSAATLPKSSLAQPMPAPQTPMPMDEVERLKVQAKKSRKVTPVAGQHDPCVIKPSKR